MRTFTVECPECDCEIDVDIEETDLADTELGHIVTCPELDCQTETEYVYDPDLDDLVPADEEEEDSTDLIADDLDETEEDEE